MKNLKIKKIEEKDIPEVVDLRISSWKDAYRGIIDDEYLQTIDRDKRIEKIKGNYKETGFIVAYINDEIAGFCRYVDNNEFTPNISSIDCELLSLYIRPDFKYMGIGTALFNYVFQEFKAKGKTKMIVWCLKDNEPAKLFYKKLDGKILYEKLEPIGGKEYEEVGFVYDIK